LADLDDLHAMDGDERVMRYIGPGLPRRTRDETTEALSRMVTYAATRPGYGLLHASRRDDGYFVGGCGLFPLLETGDIEIAYRLRQDCWDYGYATEMARVVLAHGFAALKLARIVGVTHPENLPSQNVLRKIGMHEEGTAVHFGRQMRVFSVAREV
jgi:RimJ/RimL family protein N-acetyltransferase